MMARAGAIPFKQLASWEVQGEDFFLEAWQAMRGHVTTFRASAVGADVVNLDVVTDGEMTEGGRSDRCRSARDRSDDGRSARSGGGKGKKRATKDSTPRKNKQLAAAGASMGTTAAAQKAALGSPLGDRGSPGTLPMAVYREACHDRDHFRHEQDVARLAAEAASRLKAELDTVKRQRDDLQAKLVDARGQRVASEAHLEVLQRSKGWRPVESKAGAASPSYSMVPIAPAATFSRHSMHLLASRLLEYGHLATRLMADARSSCQQLQTMRGWLEQPRCWT